MSDAVSAVVFDVGGVLLDWNPENLYRKVITDPDALAHFLTEVCPHDWHLQHDQGVPMAETLPARQAEFPDHAELIGLWSSRQLEMVSGEVPGTAAVLHELIDLGLAVHGLTNMPAEVWPGLLSQWPVLTRFDGVVVSGEERLVKPDPAIFDVLVERFGLDRGTTVFIDDMPHNVEAATRCGLIGLRFTDADGLRAALRRLGVPLA